MLLMKKVNISSIVKEQMNTKEQYNYMRKIVTFLLLIIISFSLQAQSLEKTYSNSRFSIKYPSSWLVVQENQAATANTTISLQVMAKQLNDYYFRPNVNIIISKEKREESTNQLALMAYKGLVKSGIQSKVVKLPSSITISGLKGSVVEYVMVLNGYSIRGIQYVLKKTDNTIYIITSSIDNSKVNSQRKINDLIINSIKIK